MKVKQYICALLAIFFAGLLNASAQSVTTNMPSITDATTFVNSGIGIAALAITGSIVIALGWKIYRGTKKLKV